MDNKNQKITEVKAAIYDCLEHIDAYTVKRQQLQQALQQLRQEQAKEQQQQPEASVIE